MIESTPVWGVAIKKDTVAPFDAPSRLSDIAVGITPHEHKGKGIPNNAAQHTDAKLLLDKYLLYNVLGTKTCIKPANKKPNNKKGDMALIKFKISCISFSFATKVSQNLCNMVAKKGFRL